MATKTTGFFQTIGSVGLGITGVYLGYQVGSEAVEYAKTISENRDVLTYIINQHPAITKLTTSCVLGSVMFEVGNLGLIVDRILGTD